jgi:hypothetical protein
MNFTPMELVMLALALIMLGVSIFTKPKQNPLLRIDPAAARASNIVMWSFFAAWPIARALGSKLTFMQVTPLPLAVCFALLLWGWFRARAV